MGDGACIICLENLLPQKISALLCGHVYHADCIQKWLSQGRPGCPQCKKKTPPGSVRCLHLETFKVTDEERRLLSDPEERARRIENLTAERDNDLALIEQLSFQQAQSKVLERDHKLARLEVEKHIPEAKKEFAEFQECVTRASRDVAEMQTHLDQEDCDCDSQEERRKSQFQKCKTLLDEINAFRQQLIEAPGLTEERIAVFEKNAQELDELRQHERELRNRLEDLQVQKKKTGEGDVCCRKCCCCDEPARQICRPISEARVVFDATGQRFDRRSSTAKKAKRYCRI